MHFAGINYAQHQPFIVVASSPREKLKEKQRFIFILKQKSILILFLLLEFLKIGSKLM